MQQLSNEMPGPVINQPPAQQTQPSQPAGGSIVPPLPVIQPKKSRFLANLVIIFVILIVLGALGIGAALAARIWDPVWNPFRPSPEKVMALMFEKMQAIKSSHSEVKIKLDMGVPNSLSSSPLEAVFTINADSDFNDLKNFKTEQETGISLTGQNPFSGSEETDLVKIKTKLIGQDEYFSISEFNAPTLAMFLALVGINPQDITGTWVKIPLSEFGLGLVDINAQLEQAEQTMGQINKIISESGIISIKKQLSDQTIGGQKMYHYLAVLDNEKTAELIANLSTEIQSQQNANLPLELQEQITPEQIKSSALQVLNKLGEISAELLIGKNDNLFYGLKVERDIDLNKIDSKTQGIVNLSIGMNCSKYNQPVIIEAPATFKNIDEVFPQLKNTLSDLKMESYMTSLANAIDLIKIKEGNLLNLSCQHNDIKVFCEGIKNLEGLDLVIRHSTNYYCAYTKLLELKNGQANYFCIDVLGNKNETTINPGLKGYCSGKTYVCPH
jgi:hypothetical protein